VQQLPDGSQVVLVDQSLFAAGGAQLNDGGRYVLASVIEGLLEPRLLRIEVADAQGTSPYLQNARAQAVTQYFVDYGLAPTLQPPAAQPVVPVGVPTQGTTITVHLASN
jgi:flagellar motor protein MotB